MNQIKANAQGLAMLAAAIRRPQKRSIMSALLLMWPTLCLAVLGAHFYRSGSLALVALCVLLLVLMLALRRAWVMRLLQMGLLLGATEWLWTTFLLVQQRLALGQPWQRLTLILLGVALATALSALVFRHPRLQKRFAGA